jgi:hypothetical protein
MSKVIRVNSINDDALKRLQDKGFTVLVVGKKTGELAALERQATKALRHGEGDKAKNIRLNMLKLIRGGKNE